MVTCHFMSNNADKEQIYSTHGKWELQKLQKKANKLLHILDNMMHKKEIY